jgi:hypothetical protein
MVVFITIDDKFVLDRIRLRRVVLADAMELDLDAARIKLQHRYCFFDTLDHAGGKSRQKQFGRVESIQPSVHIGVEDYPSLFGRYLTAMSVDASCTNIAFEYPGPPSGSCFRARHQEDGSFVLRFHRQFGIGQPSINLDQIAIWIHEP